MLVLEDARRDFSRTWNTRTLETEVEVSSRSRVQRKISIRIYLFQYSRAAN